jgi:hypothetical protein
MRRAERWISERRAFWEQNLDSLGEYLAEETQSTRKASKQ